MGATILLSFRRSSIRGPFLMSIAVGSSIAILSFVVIAVHSSSSRVVGGGTATKANGNPHNPQHHHQRRRHLASSFPSCQSNHDCTTTTADGSTTSSRAMECIDGQCINPFVKGGCLAQRKPGWKRLRVCNSEDSIQVQQTKGYCRRPLMDGGSSAGGALNYNEVRILAQNWESSNFASWVLQILLNEMLDVPSTIETGVADKVLNFYDPTSRFEYGNANIWDALKRSNHVAENDGGDCRQVQQQPQQNDNNSLIYQPCGHVMLEVWASNHKDALHRLLLDNEIETPTGLGALGEMGWYLPSFTARQDPSFLSYLGVMGESNRHKLANAFLTPTTWGDYCNLVSNSSCQVPDDVAKRPPNHNNDDDESQRMFMEGQYTGYFRKAPQNDCSLNNETFQCTGHFADFPCDWGSYFEAQAFHLQIPASTPRYTYNQLVDIIKAGNATKSNFMLYWWTPEALLQSFRGSDMEMIRIGLPSPTQQCLNSRISPTERCLPEVVNSPPSIRYGDPEGSCDEAPQNLQKVIATSLLPNHKKRKSPQSTSTSLTSQDEIVLQSPAYETISNFKINDMNFADFVESWFIGNQDVREAACTWLINNFDLVQNFIPHQYPRTLQETPTSYPLFYIALTIASIALLLSIGATLMVAHRRNHTIMIYSQIEFLFLLLVGGFLVALGSIINLIMEPSNATCITIIWLVSNGYTLLLVPLIIKVAAMNRLMRAARKFRRVVLKRKQLFGAVAAIEALVIIYLIIWTAIDPPRKQAQYDLTGTQTDVGDYIVNVGYYCDSNSTAWRIGSASWNFLLIVCATIFAFVTRTFESQFRETQTLAFMIYSQFIFAVLRFVVVLWNTDRSDLRLVQSIIYSFDIAATVVIYFVPKFLTKGPQRINSSFGDQAFTRSSVIFGTDQAHTLSSVGGSGRQLIQGQNCVCRHCGKNPFMDLDELKESGVGASDVEGAKVSSFADASINSAAPELCPFVSSSTTTASAPHPASESENSGEVNCNCEIQPVANGWVNRKGQVVARGRRRSWEPRSQVGQGIFLDEGKFIDDEVPKPMTRKTWHSESLAKQIALVGRISCNSDDDEES